MSRKQERTVLLAVTIPGEVTTLDDLERWFVQLTLAAHDGDKTKTAKRLGIDRRTLYRKLDEWGLSQKYRRRGDQEQDES